MKSKIQYIDNDKDLQKVVEVLSKRKAIYIDLEFDKNHFRYGFNLCLMQIYDGQTCYLIDPLKGLDIQLVFPVLEDENIQLVCFTFNEDMRLLYHIGAQPNNIVDLAVATRLLNYDSLSLNNTLSTVLGDKSPVEGKSNQQKSNWFQRPLTEKQHLYAAEDVLYLPLLKDQIMKRLTDTNRTDWFEEEMFAFENYDWSGGEKVAYLTKKDRKQLSLREWIRFEKIMDYREELAAAIDRPTYRALDKNVVLKIAQSPELVEHWTTTKGVHPKFKNSKVQTKIQALLKTAEQEIEKNKIDKNQPSITPPSAEERLVGSQRRNRVRNTKENFLLPIKEEVKSVYGENFGNYFLSNRKMGEYITQEQVLLPYQKSIIENIAQKLNLSLPQFVLINT